MEEAIFAIGVGITVLRFDRNLTDLGPFVSRTGVFVVIGGNKIRADDGFTGGTSNLTCLTGTFVGPTGLADGAYYVPPPYIWSAADGSYVERIQGAALTVL